VIWVLAVVVVGLIAVLAELLLSYQKRANDLRSKQEPVRRRIREHNRAMQEAVGGIQAAAQGRVDELTAELQQLAQQADTLREQVERLARAAPAPAESDDDEDSPAAQVGQLQDLMRVEVDGNRLSLQRDVEVVRRTLTLLQSKLRRSPGVSD
jgi:chromosome segregation ATPase